MIEPVAGHDITKKTQHPHVVYKRSPDEFQSVGIARNLCNVVNDTSRTIAKRALNPGRKMPAKQNESRSYTVELLVVLDKSLLDHRRGFDVENYVLTLFNMVSLTQKSLQAQFRMEISGKPLFSGSRTVSWRQFRCARAANHRENYTIRGGGERGKVIGESFLRLD